MHWNWAFFHFNSLFLLLNKVWNLSLFSISIPNCIGILLKVDLIHINAIQGNDTVSYGMDLSEYYLNVEWDILSVPAERHVKTYPCCPEPYPGKNTTFNVLVAKKRKPVDYFIRSFFSKLAFLLLWFYGL